MNDSADQVPIASDEDVSIRLMRDRHDDYVLISQWRSDDRVLEFVWGRDNPMDLALAYEHYGPRARAEDPVVPCIIERGDEPIGYIQYYPVLDKREYRIEDATGVFGIDLFIGEPDLWGAGLGTRALALLVDYLFEAKSANKIVIDPHVTNERAVRSYEKAGFARVKVLEQHEMHEGAMRDAWLMVVDRPDWLSRRAESN